MLAQGLVLSRSSRWMISSLGQRPRRAISIVLANTRQGSHHQDLCSPSLVAQADTYIATLSDRCEGGSTLDELREFPLQAPVFESKRRAFSTRLLQHTAEPVMEGFARRLWEASQNDAYAALYHPFVVALACGSLHPSAFQTYIAQDVYFLGAFVEAYRLTMENADDEGDKVILERLILHVQDELDQVHFEATKRLSLELTKEPTKPNPATISYTEFLLGVARGDSRLRNFAVFDESQQQEPNGMSDSEIVLRRKRKIAAYTIAAMIPCVRLYTFLGQKITKSLEGKTISNPYAQWIDAYASTDFESSTLLNEHLLHRLAMPFPGEIDRQAMERLYRRAMELEVGFFAAQPLSRNTIPILVPLLRSEIASDSHFMLVSDFDSTCTFSDSCPVLADLSVSTAQKVIAAGGPAKPAAFSLRSRWDSLADLHAEEYTQLLDRLLLTQGNGSKEIERRYNPELLRKLLQQLSEFEIVFNARVVDSGVLADLNMEDVKKAGSSLPLRQGCKELLERFFYDGSLLDFHILSVCWSRSFIEGSLLESGLKFSNIHCNELQFDIRGTSTGNIVRIVQTAEDKEKVFLDILNQTGEKLGSAKTTFSVYLGDSVTDLLCMLTADIGIVIGESTSLERVAETCGITFLPLYSGLLQQQQRIAQKEEKPGRWSKVDGVLYRISSWYELRAFLLGS